MTTVGAVSPTGDFSTWNADYDFGLGNEFSAASNNTVRDWQGEYHLVAVYSKALSAVEVSQNYAEGLGPATLPTILAIGDTAMFTAGYKFTGLEMEDPYKNIASIDGTPTVGSVVTGVDSAQVFLSNIDYGDLPDIANGTTGNTDYETYDSTGGPSHQIITGLFLGDTVDIDTDGHPNSMALGDDADNVDDEDGLVITDSLDIRPGRPFRLPLSVTNTTGDTAYIIAWIDWNGDGDFADMDELVVDIKDNTDGVFPTYLEINTPDIALKGSLIGLRVRLSNQNGLTPYGASTSGEVEDYLLGVECPQVCLSITTNVVRDE